MIILLALRDIYALRRVEEFLKGAFSPNVSLSRQRYYVYKLDSLESP